MIPLPGPSTTRRELALAVWASYHNAPYLWGGDDPLAGVDCSGLVNEGLKSVGSMPREADFSSDGLLNILFKSKTRLQETQLTHGCLLFYAALGKPVHHVEIVWTRADGEIFTIGASGGGSRTVDRAEAIKSNAYVKIRRATPGWVAAIDPFDNR